MSRSTPITCVSKMMVQIISNYQTHPTSFQWCQSMETRGESKMYFKLQGRVRLDIFSICPIKTQKIIFFNKKYSKKGIFQNIGGHYKNIQTPLDSHLEEFNPPPPSLHHCQFYSCSNSFKQLKEPLLVAWKKSTRARLKTYCLYSIIIQHFYCLYNTYPQ